MGIDRCLGLGLSRILDHLELEPWIDHHRIAVMGHSASGKQRCGRVPQTRGLLW